MKFARILIAAVILAYAGWLAWPFLSPFIEGGNADIGAMRAGADAATGGDLFGIIPGWALWAAAIVLYFVAALMLGSGNTKAAVAYFLGFIADAVLRLAMNSGGPDANARSAGPTTLATDSGLPVEPVWLVLGGLFLLGVLVVILARRQRKRRVAGQLAF
jgi:hypothetical protein